MFVGVEYERLLRPLDKKTNLGGCAIFMSPGFPPVYAVLGCFEHRERASWLSYYLFRYV
jgi:hypothetical protein